MLLDRSTGFSWEECSVPSAIVDEGRVREKLAIRGVACELGGTKVAPSDHPVRIRCLSGNRTPLMITR